MLKPAVTVSLLIAATTSAVADTQTTTADTLVVVTPNAPVIVSQGAAPAAVAQPIMPPGAAEMPPAPPAAAPAAANGAPQNEDWNNVSHINGVPVKVGERQDYLLKPKKYNLATNPFGYFFGYYDIAASMAVSNNLAASVAVTGWNLSQYDQGYQLSATLPLFFRKTFSGPFLEGGLLIRTTDEQDYYYAADCYDCSSTMETSNTWAGPQLLFGWQWTFDSGLNASFAFGLAKRINGGDEGTDGNGYFRVGYAF